MNNLEANFDLNTQLSFKLLATSVGKQIGFGSFQKLFRDNKEKKLKKTSAETCYK